jgi:signal recognition particle GTPase
VVLAHLQAKQPMEVTKDGSLQAVVDELGSMLSSGLDNEKQLVDLKKGKPNVVMFVGLQASLAYTCCSSVPTHCVSSFLWASRRAAVSGSLHAADSDAPTAG